VRCLARQPERLSTQVAHSTQVVYGDVLKVETLIPTMRVITTAYYLVHSMASAGDFEVEDREGARNFAMAAQEAGVSSELGNNGN
jgi:uncharacterized protein YbjT (DUF2867 family)